MAHHRMAVFKEQQDQMYERMIEDEKQQVLEEGSLLRTLFSTVAHCIIAVG